MTGHAGAGRGLSNVAITSRVACSVSYVRAAWRDLTWTQFLWTLSIGVIAGFVFLGSHSMHRVESLLLHKASLGDTIWASSAAIGTSVVIAVLFLLAVSVASHGDRGQAGAWWRYALATFVATAALTALVHFLSPYVPVAGMVGWYNLGSQIAIDSFVFLNWLLFGGLAVFVYVRLGRARRSQAAFERAEFERAATKRQVLRAQLAAMQAQVEPRFLFNALCQVEALYERHAACADRLLDDLIAYLRAALPQLRGEESTLARETELLQAYLRIVQARMGSRLEFAFDIPPELGATPFPPMLLLPLIDNAVRNGLEPLPLGGSIEVRAAAHANRLRLTVSDTGLGDAIALQYGHGLSAVRERLAGLYGQGASLTLSAGKPHGVAATVEVPYK